MTIETNQSQQDPIDRGAKRRHLEIDKRGTTRQVWRRVGADQDTDLEVPNNQDSRPFAQTGERCPPESAARSKDSSEIVPPAPPITPQTRHLQHTAPCTEEPDKCVQETPRKLIAAIPEELLSKLRATCEAKASTSLLGRIQGKHPGLKALTAWAWDALHPSLTLLSLKSNNLFEVTFEHAEGRLHALKQTDLTCEAATIFFSSWRPHFDSRTPQARDNLDYPVWVQIVNLCQILREDTFLRTIGEQLGQIISIDNSDAYKAKLCGPRIRLLVQDLNNLPQTVVIPRLDGEGVV